MAQKTHWLYIEEAQPGIYHFVTPPEANRIVVDYYDALEQYQRGRLDEALKLVKPVIEQVAGYFPAYNLLIDIYQKQEKRAEGNRVMIDADKELYFIFRGIDRDRTVLPWEFHENRGFLTYYFNRGKGHFKQGNFKDARMIFWELINMEPRDELGVKEYLSRVAFELAFPHEVLTVCRKFSELNLPMLAFNEVLARFQMGQKREAKELFQRSAALYPKIAKKLLLKGRHKPLSTSQYIQVSPQVEMMQRYWRRFGIYWQKTPGAQDFVAKLLKK